MGTGDNFAFEGDLVSSDFGEGSETDASPSLILREMGCKLSQGLGEIRIGADERRSRHGRWLREVFVDG
jgi:hypothetical protein